MASRGDLVVSLTGLSDLAAGLRSIKTRMDDTGQVDRALGGGELGSGKAQGALEDFMHGWKDGRKEIDGGLDSVSKMADGIVEGFTKADHELASALEKARHERHGGT